MSKKIIHSYSRFAGGIADFKKESLIPDSFADGRSVDVRTDPQNIGILPRTIKESGAAIIDLPKWAVTIPDNTTTYMYGEGGNFYRRTSASVYTNMRTVANSHGNGLGYFGEDGFVYYTLDKVIGRYGPLTAASPQFTDDFLGAQGGVPLNTNSLDLESSSSQYADRADTASLSITSDIAISAQIKPESLPASGSSMTLVSKWTENGNTRSYIFDILGVSGYFGSGSDGALTISTNTTESPTDSACTGTSGATSLSATNASFASGQIILIHQSRGTGAGTWQRNTIASYTAGTITLTTALNSDYVSGAQVRVLPQYSGVTVNTGITYTTKAWNGTVGGILAFICSGSITIAGTITAAGSPGAIATGGTGGGFRGGAPTEGTSTSAYQGEGTGGAGTASGAANGNGGGGGTSGNANNQIGAGAGGGNGTTGSIGRVTGTGVSGDVGAVAGTADLTTMVFGGGGGGLSQQGPGPVSSEAGGSSGGGIIFLISSDVVVTGSITANGGAAFAGDGAAGAGGSILIKAQTATLGTGLITASGGAAEVHGYGAGGAGRVHLDYYTSYTGTTTPTLNATQDSTLVTNTSYQLRFRVSSNGTNSSSMSQIASLVTGVWQQVGVSWVASTSVATFYVNAMSIGTSTGNLNAISDNASRFAVGAYRDGTPTVTGFYDGLIDEVQLYNTTQSAAQFLAAISSQVPTNSIGLAAYYKFNGAATDSTANANTLTLVNGPVYSSDVPFPSPTTRLDIDQSATTNGNTYTTPISISESSTNRKTFTPAKDPQKSLSVLIASVGTGNWTVTIHDQYNNSLDSKTVTNANLYTGYYEFVFPSVWRPLTNFTGNYHFHVTSTVADGTVTTGSADDLETVSYRTYFQFLVNDADFHPVMPMLNFMAIGNERYVATWDGILYAPNQIVLASGWRVRSLAFWREYLVIGCWKGSDIQSFDEGRIYFWDGISPTFNTYIDVPEGGINAMLGERGLLNVWAGSQGEHLVYQGGDSAEIVKRVPNLASNTYTEVFPGAVTMWKKLVRYGVAGNSDSTDINRGVYSWGKFNLKYPPILTFDYPISTGNYQGTNIRVGMATTVNDKLLIGWQDNVSYGVDYVSSSNNVYPSASISFLINDDNLIWKQKEAVTLAANFDTLIAGQSINLKYKRDDDSSWTTNPTATATGNTVSRFVFSAGRHNQIQVACDLATTVSTGPTVNGISLEIETMDTAGRVG